MAASPVTYRCQRAPAEIMAPRVRLSVRLPRSERTGAEVMVERDVRVSYATIRRWCLTVGPVIAAELTRREHFCPGRQRLPAVR